MSSNIHDIGVFSWFGFVMPLSERLKLIKNAGFDTTSLWWEDENSDPVVYKNEMPHMVRDNGLKIDNIHAPFNSSNYLWSESAQLRHEAIGLHKRWLDDCAKYDIPIMVMHITEGIDIPAPNKYGVESMEDIVKTARDLGVKVAIENTRRKDNVPFLLERISSNYLGCCFDSSHAFLTKDVDEVLLKKWGHRLIATHLSDNDGVQDRHWIPGNGNIDWASLCRIFPNESYEGSLMMEICPDEYEALLSPQYFLDKAYKNIYKVYKIITGSN